MTIKRKAKKPGTRPPRDELSPEHQRFCEVYALNGGNGADAVQKAFKGWARKGGQARCEKASKLLANGKVLARVSALRAQNAKVVENRYLLTADKILEELAKIALFNLADYIKIGANGIPFADFSNVTRDQMAALASIEIEQMVVQDDDDDGGSGAPMARGSFEGEEPAKPPMVGLKVKLKGGNKHGALVDLGKNCGLWKEPKPETHVHLHLSDRLRSAIERKRAAARVAG